MAADAQPAPNLQSIQIIVLAMGGGLVGAGVMSLLLQNPAASSNSLFPTLAMVWFVLGVSQLAAWFGVSASLRRSAAAKWREGPKDEAAVRAITGVFFTAAILRSALIEGWGLFGAVIVFITGQPWTLAGPAVGVALLLASLPTESRLRGFFSSVTGGEAK